MHVPVTPHLLLGGLLAFRQLIRDNRKILFREVTLIQAKPN